MTEPAPETKKARTVRLLDMRHGKRMTLGAIANIERVTPTRIGQLIGKTGLVRPMSGSLLKIYRFIDAYWLEHKYAPSFAEIAKVVPARNGEPTSSSVVKYWLDRMEKLNMIAERPAKVARCVRTLPLNRRSPEIREMLRAEEAQAKALAEENNQ